MNNPEVIDLNLRELRYELTSRVAILTAVMGGLSVWWRLFSDALPDLTLLFLASSLGLGLIVRQLSASKPKIAAHLLIWGLTISLLGGMFLFPFIWIPFLTLILVFISILLVKYSEWVIIALVTGVAVILSQMGLRAYPFPEMPFALLAGAVAARLITRGLYTALEWSWSAQRQAREMLELARNRQEELNQTLKSLELAYSLQRRTQRELYYARKQAEEARQAKEKFAANISHELRTPLNLILGFSEVMYMSPSVYGNVQWPASLHRDVHYIYRNSRHLLEMIDDILDLAHLDMTEFSLNLEPTSIPELILNTADIARDLFRAKPVHLITEIADDLPTMNLDRTRIRQVLLNLLNNARRYTEEGMITMKAEKVGRDVVISVSDTGIGIAADKLPFLFDEFYQADRSLTRNSEGVGLGLAICKHFVEAHQGRIWVESTEKVGSTFLFSLPISQSASVYQAAELNIQSSTTDTTDRAPVLVVDPDPRVAVLVGRHSSIDAISVRDAADLPREVELHHPQAVIYNTLPGKLPEYAAGIPESVVSFTCSLPSQSWIAVNLQVASCLTKPVGIKELQAEMERFREVRRVLVVDNDRGFCHLVERMIKSSSPDVRVEIALDGAEGLEAMRHNPPDLLLLDLMMPVLDGFEVVEHMRDDPLLRNIPVILLTATSYGEDALNQRGSRIVIERGSGLHPAETLRCLHAVLGELHSDYGSAVLANS